MLTDLALTVPEPFRTATWYEMLGGWADSDGDIPKVHFNGLTLYFWQGAPASRIALGLFVNDYDKTKKLITDAGYEIRMAGSSTRQFSVRDPDDNLVTVRARSAG